MTWRDWFRLLAAVWAVRRGRMQRIVVPRTFKVWREARGAVVVELLK